jgi:dolichyl-phosphate beta-glucosyltransferase
MNERAPELSIIIPAYNEEKRLSRTLARIRDYFASQDAVLGGIVLGDIEILVVDDGSTDGTDAVAQDWERQVPGVRLIRNDGNRGKGFSVKHGMLEARGRIALFTDADLSSPIEESRQLFAALKAGNDIAIGSRALDRSLIVVRQSLLRETAGIIFNGFVRFFTGLPFHDTQCGFKAFVLDRARPVFEQQRIERFGFDPEILFIAKRHGLRTAEVPVHWAHDEGTKVHVFRDSLLMFLDLALIRWNSLLGRYPKANP